MAVILFARRSRRSWLPRGHEEDATWPQIPLWHFALGWTHFYSIKESPPKGRAHSLGGGESGVTKSSRHLPGSATNDRGDLTVCRTWRVRTLRCRMLRPPAHRRRRLPHRVRDT